MITWLEFCWSDKSPLRNKLTSNKLMKSLKRLPDRCICPCHHNKNNLLTQKASGGGDGEFDDVDIQQLDWVEGNKKVIIFSHNVVEIIINMKMKIIMDVKRDKTLISLKKVRAFFIYETSL